MSEAYAKEFSDPRIPAIITVEGVLASEALASKRVPVDGELWRATVGPRRVDGTNPQDYICGIRIAIRWKGEGARVPEADHKALHDHAEAMQAVLREAMIENHRKSRKSEPCEESSFSKWGRRVRGFLTGAPVTDFAGYRTTIFVCQDSQQPWTPLPEATYGRAIAALRRAHFLPENFIQPDMPFIRPAERRETTPAVVLPVRGAPSRGGMVNGVSAGRGR